MRSERVVKILKYLIHMASPPSVQHSDLSAATHELLTAVGQNPINK